MEKENIIFAVLFIFSFCLIGIIEYGVIVTAVPSTDPLEVFTPLWQSIVNAIPGLILGMVLIGIWSWYCYRTFPNIHKTTKVPEKANIDIRLEAALLDRDMACRGTHADRMWFTGIIWALAGGGIYMILMVIDVSPARTLIKIFN